jgi:sugar lactone lactonase YvrE
MPSPTPIESVRGELLESPVWSVAEQALYLVDIVAQQLIRYRPAEGSVKKWCMPGDVGCVALRNRPGQVALGLRSGLFGFDTSSEVLEPLAPVDYDVRTTRFNDGCVDRTGRLWIGTIYEPRDHPAAILYRYDGKDALKHVRKGFTTSNGLAFSREGDIVYFADTPQRKVWVFDLDEEGELHRQRIFIDFDTANLPGRPDGATVDAEGCYWLALLDAWRVARFDPQGKLMREIELPVRWPTKPCFGGTDLKTLYVTSLRTGREPGQLAESPLSGTLIAVDTDIAGLPESAARF